MIAEYYYDSNTESELRPRVGTAATRHSFFQKFWTLEAREIVEGGRDGGEREREREREREKGGIGLSSWCSCPLLSLSLLPTTTRRRRLDGASAAWVADKERRGQNLKVILCERKAAGGERRRGTISCLASPSPWFSWLRVVKAKRI